MTDVHQRTPNAPAYDIAAKILLIGEAGVGKTHLILRYVDNIFEPQLVKCTVQPDVKSKDLNVHDKKVRLRIWDTAGSERFRAINRSFFRNALGVIVVYDVTDRTTFTKVKSWLEEVEINCDKQPVTILVGNKTDLSDQRQVSTQEGRELAKRCKLMFMEASAKTRENVNDVFYELAEKIIENPALFESSQPKETVNLNAQNQSWMGWLSGQISSWSSCNIL